MIDQMSAFLQKLRKSTAGNTLAIAAAALVPLVGMVGGAVDISRYYMAAARMQNACDAGALAARKQMEAGEFEEEDRDLGLRFFDQNYPDGTFGLENLDRDYVADDDGTVTGTATGEMPTTIMQIFGKTGMDISVSCSAEINISNTDIMFVLDVTGSMDRKPDGTSCWGGCGSESRIAGLRTAVLDFYDAVETATSDSAQVRYGIVPYATNINVGAAIPTQYMATEHTYQSREADDPTLQQWWEAVSTTVDGYSNQGSVDHDQDVYWGWGRQNQEWHCQRRQPAAVPLTYVPDTLQENTIQVVSETQNGNIRTRQLTGRGMLREVVPSYEYPGGNWCRTYRNVYESWADIEITVVDEFREEMVFTNWIYKPVTYDVSAVLTGGTFMAPIGRDGNYLRNVEIGWTNGCIEEADTSTSATWDPIPDGAYDLDINLKPTTNEQKWRPMLRDLVYRRESNGYYYPWLYQSWDENHPSMPCPTAAMRLSEITRTELENYVSEANGFVASGNTYHDIGMIWGARFISPRGIFEDDNESAPNGDSIARHIVFMTDGVLEVNDGLYGTYGIEWWDRRVSPDGSGSGARHAARFQAACRKAREENIAVWVVAFGTTLTQNLIDCATPGRAYSAASSEQLNAAFREIAQKIAALRLTS